ncbi:MAG: hypothetical protein ACRDJY_08470 [Thermoleophilaceae bacterium]
MGLRRLFLALACAATAATISGCFLEEEKEEGEPIREGLAVKVGGVEYTVYITRELNPSLPDDRTYWTGEEAEPGFALYGVFLQACNRSDEDDDLEDATYEATEDFIVVDTQGNEYEPLEAEEENAFQYHPQEIEPGECIPENGSLAQQGPTAGLMLPFLFPLEAGENRPLELEIRSEGEEAAVELDL